MMMMMMIPIEVIVVGNITDVKFKHLLNALSATVVTLLAKVILHGFDLHKEAQHPEPVVKHTVSSMLVLRNILIVILIVPPGPGGTVGAAVGAKLGDTVGIGTVGSLVGAVVG